MSDLEFPIEASTLVACADARAARDCVVAQVRATRTKPQLLRGRILVSSQALRSAMLVHLAEALGPCVGVTVQTLAGYAHGLLAEQSRRADAFDALYAVIARERARQVPELAELDRFRGGLNLVSEGASDLLSAGLDPANLPALQESLADVPQVAALAGVAVDAQRKLHELGFARSGDIFAAAAECQRALQLAEGAPLTPFGDAWVLVGGFADATGQAQALLAALVAAGASVIVDRAQCAGWPEPVAFTERFSEQLWARRRAQVDGATEATVAVVDAPDREAELRDIALQIGQLLDQGCRPGSIGVVARSLTGYQTSIARWFERYGIPYDKSALSPQPTAADYRVQAALRLIAQPEDATVDAWLAAHEQPAEIRLGARALGIARLDEFAQLELDPALMLGLPRRFGLRIVIDDEEADDVDVVAGDERDEARYEVSAAQLLDAAARAQQAVAALNAWPDVAPVDQQLQRLGQWLATLAFPADAIACLQDDLAPLSTLRHALSTADFAELAAAALERAKQPDARDGVWVLDVARARGLTFSHLFVLGLCRGEFPRSIRDDGVLPDRTRTRLRELLPALGLRRDGVQEERYLFASLLGAAEHVHLSFRRNDADGRALVPSPLLLPWRLSEQAIRRLPRARRRLLATSEAEDARCVWDRSCHQALVGADPQLWFATCAAVSGDEHPPNYWLRRLEAVEWYQRAPAADAVANPFWGVVGPTSVTGAAYVTTLEAYAVCPWQTFLRRILRLRPAPDPAADLPGLDPALIGSATHAALEQLLQPRDGKSRKKGTIERPSGDRIAQAVADASQVVAHDAGVRLPGLVRALTQVVQPMVERAIELDWPMPGSRVDVAKVEASHRFRFQDRKGRSYDVAYRADRVDRVAGHRRFTDYKTGGSVVTAKRPEARRRQLSRAIQRGAALQAAVYAAGGDPGDSGRFLLLGSGLADDQRNVSVQADDQSLNAVTKETLARLIDGFQAGLFVPRLEDTRGLEPRACRNCDVAEACSRGDSSVRAQLRMRSEGDGLLAEILALGRSS